MATRLSSVYWTLAIQKCQKYNNKKLPHLPFKIGRSCVFRLITSNTEEPVTLVLVVCTNPCANL